MTSDWEELQDDDIDPGTRTLAIYPDEDADFGTVADPDSLDWGRVRKRPVVVDAVQLDQRFEVDTWEGTMEADAGHWLVRGVEGELYPVAPDVFEQTYIRAADAVEGDLDRASLFLSEAQRTRPDPFETLDGMSKRDRVMDALMELAAWLEAHDAADDAADDSGATDVGGD